MARISRTGTTDSTGVASITVTGSGGGRLKFISRNGGLWSNSKEIEDLIFYDNATESSHNDNWFIRLPNLTTMTREADGTVIEWTGTYGHIECENGRFYNIPTVIEFDVLEQSNARIQYYSGSATNIERSASLTRTGHYRCINTLNSQKIYCDDDLLYEFSISFNQYYFAFLSNVSGDVERMIKFSNFKVYPFFTAPQHYTPIALSSSASIIQTGETATLTAELTNVLGEKLASKSVNFIEKSTPFKYSTEYTRTSSSSTAQYIVTDEKFSISNSHDWSIEADIKASASGQRMDLRVGDGATDVHIGIGRNASGILAVSYTTNSGTENNPSFSDYTFNTNTYYHIKLEKVDSTLNAYFGNELIWSNSSLNWVSDETLVFQVYGVQWRAGDIYLNNIKCSGDVSYILDTETTNSQGVATTTITSNQTGERQFITKADNIESEPITIEDNLFYDSLTSASGEWTIPSGVTSTYSSDGWRVSANAYSQVKLTDKLTEPCSVEITITDYNETTSDASVILYAYTNGETTPNQLILTNNKSISMNVLGTTLNRPVVKGATYKVEYTSSTIKVYENGELLGSASNNVGLPTRFEFHIGASGRYAVYKDLKVLKL